MGLLQKIKSALGLDGARSPDAGARSTGDVDVTVEREPSSESEDAVKGTETASAGTETVDEPDDVGVETEADTTGDEVPVEEAEDEPTADEPADESAADESNEEEPAEPESGGAAAPVTEINGIGPAYGQRLSDAGVETVAELSDADPDELAEATDISASRIEGWIDAAREF